MVVIEKFEGPCWDHCFVHPVPSECDPSCNTEGYILGTAQALKKVNPKISVVMYLNSLLNFPNYHLTGYYFANPTLLLHDENGKIGHLQNDAGLGNLTVPDFSIAEARNLWLEAIRNATQTGLIDGIFADKAVKNANEDQVCNHGCIKLKHDKAEAWAAGHLNIVRTGHAQLGDGIMMRKGGSLVDGERDASVYNEWSSPPTKANVEETIKLRQQVTGYVFAYAGKKCDSNTVAAFLMVMDTRVYLQCETWLDEFDKSLGEPTGPTSIVHDVYSRSFASGTTATWNSKTGKGSITWATAVLV